MPSRREREREKGKSSNNGTAEYLIKIAYLRHENERARGKAHKCEMCVAIECVNDVVIWYTSFALWHQQPLKISQDKQGRATFCIFSNEKSTQIYLLLCKFFH